VRERSSERATERASERDHAQARYQAAGNQRALIMVCNRSKKVAERKRERESERERN
jgi:hypothetical protein